jgi:hypothetical protein
MFKIEGGRKDGRGGDWIEYPGFIQVRSEEGSRSTRGRAEASLVVSSGGERPSESIRVGAGYGAGDLPRADNNERGRDKPAWESQISRLMAYACGGGGGGGVVMRGGKKPVGRREAGATKLDDQIFDV